MEAVPHQVECTRCRRTPGGWLLSGRALQLVLRSINTSRSAYAAVTFQQHQQRFFSAYDTFGNQVVQAGIVLKVPARRAVLRASLPKMRMR